MSKLWPGSNHHTQYPDSQQAQGNAQPGAAGCGGSGAGGGANTGGASPPGTLTRNVLVHIAGNRATWEHMGMHGAMWQINPDRAANIFADPTSACGMGGADSAHEGAIIADKLSRAMIRRVTLLESNTNIDEVVAIQIDGLPAREFTKNGEGASVFLTGEGRVTQPQELFQLSGNAELGLQWMRQFPRYTSYHLEDVGVLFLTGAS
jgi:hypothetical protein